MSIVCWIVSIYYEKVGVILEYIYRMTLKAVLRLQGVVFLVECVHPINHLLHKLNLRVTQPVLVGDVVGDAGLATRLSPGAPGLQVQFLATSCQGLQALLGPAGKVDVD